MPDDLLSPAEVAELLGICLSTVYNWRTKHIGPVGFRVGNRVRYRRSDVDAWVAAQAKAGHDRRDEHDERDVAPPPQQTYHHH